jgi:4-aminobutyrate aminotransferase-like enzyme
VKKQAMLTNTGAEAVENAAKIARQSHKKQFYVTQTFLVVP